MNERTPQPGLFKADWTSEYAQLLADCERRESRLTDWERNFVDSLTRQIAEGRAPTPKQIETLDTIWEKATAKG
jgi:hypothetical protein